jgi:hypothetical protein
VAWSGRLTVQCSVSGQQTDLYLRTRGTTQRAKTMKLIRLIPEGLFS